METEEVVCDLCGSAEALPLYTLRDTFHHISGEFVLRRCTNCGLMYLSPRPTPAGILTYYPEGYTNYRPAVEDERLGVMRWMRRRKLTKRRRLIEKHSSMTPGRLLDVGCSTGLFLHEMDLAGWDVVGVEPVAHAVAYARQRFGLRVFEGMFLSELPFSGRFDVITLWDVLEHTFSPLAVLQKAASILRPGGVIALSVPNWHSLIRWIFKQHWQGLDPPRHLYVFTRKTLTAMLSKAGFNVELWTCFVSGYFSTAMSLERWLRTSVRPGMADKVVKFLSLPGMRFPFEPWFALNNWLKKGPIIAVLARKKGSRDFHIA